MLAEPYLGLLEVFAEFLSGPYLDFSKPPCLVRDPDEDTSSINTTNRKSNESQSNYAVCPYSHLLIPTPEKDEELENANFATSKHQRLVLARESPLPVLGWVNRDELWQNMLNKEQKYTRDKLYMEKHPLLEPKMRVILLDWLMEVCEVHRLHRETFYLAQDFFDRFMATQQNVEIYPPKLHQFAYVTDGACTEEDIISMELIIMKDKAQSKQATLAVKNRCSPLPTGVLTPPQSSKKLSQSSK
ncbi:G1/S-specific cyclin-E1, partial [Ophiophagus hannah]